LIYRGWTSDPIAVRRKKNKDQKRIEQQ